MTRNAQRTTKEEHKTNKATTICTRFSSRCKSWLMKRQIKKTTTKRIDDPELALLKYTEVEKPIKNKGSN